MRLHGERPLAHAEVGLCKRAIDGQLLRALERKGRRIKKVNPSFGWNRRRLFPGNR